jgi:hypothetical protein
MQYLYAGIMPAFLFVVLFFWIASSPATNDEQPATHQNVHVTKLSVGKHEVSRHCEGFSPEAIQ